MTPRDRVKRAQQMLTEAIDMMTPDNPSDRYIGRQLCMHANTVNALRTGTATRVSGGVIVALSYALTTGQMPCDLVDWL